jgi:hypothetical protein
MQCRTGKSCVAGRAVYQDVNRLDVLVDEASLVELAQSHGNIDSQVQEASVSLLTTLYVRSHPVSQVR